MEYSQMDHMTNRGNKYINGIKKVKKKFLSIFNSLCELNFPLLFPLPLPVRRNTQLKTYMYKGVRTKNILHIQNIEAHALYYSHVYQNDYY